VPLKGKGVTREFIVIHLRVNEHRPLSPIEKKEINLGQRISMKNRILWCEHGQDPSPGCVEMRAPASEG